MLTFSVFRWFDIEPSSRIPEEDPFADPIAPDVYMTQYVYLRYLRPSHLQLLIDAYRPKFPQEYHHDPAESHRDRDMHGPIVMPLPSFQPVTLKPIHHAPSTSNFRDGDTGKFGMLVDTESVFSLHKILPFFKRLSVYSEFIPLLSRPGTPNKQKPTSYLQTSAQHHSHSQIMSVSPLVHSSSQSTTSNGHANSWNPNPNSYSRLHTLGNWIKYLLPDGTVYYVHPKSRVTTEINLKSERMLTEVERFLVDHDKDHSGAGNAMETGEMWLRDVGTAKSGMLLERWWVDHTAKTVVSVGDERWKGPEMGKAKKGGTILFEEDRELKSLAAELWAIIDCVGFLRT